MGIVYLGRHRALDRKVAIKELPPSFAVDPTVRERFLTEARVVASLDHPHIVVIHDFVDRDGHLALVMEHLPNGTVWEQFLHHGLAAPRACGLVLATLAGVHHAHDRGIMHRDIKPENLIFTHDWQLKVTDFGIAQVLSGNQTMGTVEGAIVGTPAYMSPEQAEGRACGPQADVYASGAMLYEMLTGSLPFPDAADALSMATARLHQDPVPIAQAGPAVPPAIADVAMTALKRRESDRFSSAEEFGVALAEAAATTWGSDWLTDAGTAVRGSEAIEHALRTTGGSPRTTPLVDTTELSDGPPNEQEPGGQPMDPAPQLDNRATVAQAPIIPRQRERVAGADLHELVPADMLNMSEVKAPRSPLVPALLALVALAVALFVALTGLGSDPMSSQGADPLEVDLTSPFAAPMQGADSVNATFLGIPIGSASVDGGEIDPGYLQYSGAGVIELTPDVADAESVPVRATNSPYPTAPFVVAAMVTLGGLGSVQSNLRGLRSRRVRIAPFIGLLISGAIAGAGIAVLAMLVLSTPASITTIVVSAAAAALGSALLGEAYRRWRRRRRLKRVTVATARRSG